MLKYQELTGRKLETLKQKKVFTILDVSNRVIIFRPESGKQIERQEPIERIDFLIAKKKRLGHLDVSDVRDAYPESRNTSYLAAIVHALTEKG
ncbi:MAG TPA: hypothetical protein PLJ62_05570 [Thermoflexales bacterium]|nr:hypothetical protein [Thermoflexales bacterium]HQW35117.1 hypothetical protein [Thermoflexales bacterium]HQZ99644.1 hypothetical protein [Thermoflexales bacterium]